MFEQMSLHVAYHFKRFPAPLVLADVQSLMLFTPDVKLLRYQLVCLSGLRLRYLLWLPIIVIAVFVA